MNFSPSIFCYGNESLIKIFTELRDLLLVEHFSKP